jgi:hypothetical protein
MRKHNAALAFEFEPRRGKRNGQWRGEVLK